MVLKRKARAVENGRIKTLSMAEDDCGLERSRHGASLSMRLLIATIDR